MKESDIIATMTVHYTSEGEGQVVAAANAVAAAQDKVAASAQGMATTTETSARRQTSAASAFDRVERSVSPAAKALYEYERIQKIVGTAVGQNSQLQERGNVVLAEAKSRYEAVVGGTQVAAKATASFGQAAGLASHELVNLSRQAQDVAVSLGSGQSFGTVLLQQGTQIADVFANSQGSVKGFLGQIASGASAVLTPMRLVVGGALGIGAAAAYMAVQWDNAQKETERALIGISQRTGTTVGDVNSFAKANSSATGLSVSEARNAAIEFTKTGAIAIAGLHGVGEAVHGFATLAGTDATEATKKLAAAFSGDLAKGADELNKTYGFLDSATRKQIETLQLQGDRMGAVQVIIDRMAPSNIKAAESVGVLTRAWTGFKNVISNIGNLPGQSDQDKLAGLQAQRTAAANTPAVGITPGGYLNTSAAFGGKSAQLSELDKQIEDLQKKLDGLKADGAVAQLRAMSLAGDGVVKSIIPQIEQIENLEKALQALQAAQSTPGVSRTLGSDDAAVTAIQNQLAALKESQAEAERYNLEVKNISSSWGNVGQSVALQLQAMQNALPVAQAWTEAGKMRAQYEATYLDLLNKGKTAQEATAIASKQEEITKAGAVASAQKMVQASEDNLDKIRAQGTEMEAVVASSIAYRDAIQAGATATQAAAIAANTLEANLMQAAKAADQLAQNEYKVKTAADEAAQAQFGHFGQQSNFFSGDTGTHDYTGVQGGNIVYNTGLIQQAQTQAGGTQALVDSAIQNGGIAGALEAIKLQPNTAGVSATAAAGSAFNYGYNELNILGPERSTIPDKIAGFDQLTQILNQQTTDPGVQRQNTLAEIAFIKSLPESAAGDQKIAELTNAINGLIGSTDSLNQTNQDLLSPYYTQDPRTSHIGFRSQGMASGGSFIVPGGYSSNDNMVGQIPLASGEEVLVRRPGEGGTQPIIIHQNITIQGNANKDEVGRTLYQSSQTLGRQIRASTA